MQFMSSWPIRLLGVCACDCTSDRHNRDLRIEAFAEIEPAIHRLMRCIGPCHHQGIFSKLGWGHRPRNATPPSFGRRSEANLFSWAGRAGTWQQSVASRPPRVLFFFFDVGGYRLASAMQSVAWSEPALPPDCSDLARQTAGHVRQATARYKET